MTFDSVHLEQRFPREAYNPLDLRRLDDSLRLSAVPFDEFNNLVRARVVEGVGTYNRIRYLRQMYDDATADDMIFEKIRDTVREREGSRLDNLLKMVASRKTTYKERIDVKHPDGLRVSVIYQHKGLRLGYD